MNRLFEADVIGALDVARGQETLVVNDAIAPRRVNTCKRLYNGCRSAEAILPTLGDRSPIISLMSTILLYTIRQALSL